MCVPRAGAAGDDCCSCDGGYVMPSVGGDDSLRTPWVGRARWYLEEGGGERRGGVEEAGVWERGGGLWPGACRETERAERVLERGIRVVA